MGSMNKAARLALSITVILASHSLAQVVNYVSSWSSTVTYGQYQIVLYSSNEYLSLTAGNIGNTPSSSPTFWQALPTASLPNSGAGAVVTPSMQGVVNANTLSGTGDLGAKITSYFSSCSYACTVYIPSGNYTYSTTITIAPPAQAKYRLIGEKGTILNYQGTGDAIFVTTNSVGQVGGANLQISGFQIIGTGSGIDGIHIQPTNGVTVSEMLIAGFGGTSGSGIWLEGPNGVSIQNNYIINNLNGIMQEPTFCIGSPTFACSPTGTGLEFDPNAIHIHDNWISGNTHWGIYSQAPAAHGLARNDVFAWNVLQSNGSAGSSYGDLFIARDLGTLIEGNYFEGSPRHIVLGTLGTGTASRSTSDHITSNYFTDTAPTGAGATPYNIELENTQWTMIDGNNDLFGTAAICEIETPASGDENGTVVGLNGFTTGNSLTCVGGSTAAYLPGTNSFTQTITQSVTFNGCAIAPGSIGTTCSAGPGYWPAPFVSSPASVVCSMAVVGTGPNTLGALTGISGAGVDVQEIALSNTAAGGGAITCMAQWSKN